MRFVAVLLSLAALVGLMINDTAPARAVAGALTAADRFGYPLAVLVLTAAAALLVRGAPRAVAAR